MLRSLFPLCFSLLVLLFSCVKEDRSSCPCVLVISTEKIADSSAVFSVYLSSGEEAVADTMSSGSVYSKAVSRGLVYATVASGDGGCYEPGKGIAIPFGRDCPPVYLWSKPVKALGETVSRSAVLSKSHCRVRMRLVPSGGGLTFTVRGGIAGFDLDGNPVEGPFECTAHRSDDGSLEFLLPRQKDNSLLMDVRSDATLLRTFALGEILSRAGYSWKDRDLKDISLEVNCSANVLISDFSVWENVQNREILL